MKVLYLYNPKAGNTAKMWLHEAQNYAIDHDINLVSASVLDDPIPDNSYDRVIIAGGDGSVNRLVNRIINTDFDKPIAIIPAGTANDYATYLGMSKIIPNSVKTAFKGKPKPVDIGVANEQAFINICGIGNLMQQPDNETRKAKKIWGKLAYLGFGLKSIFKMRNCKIKIETMGKTYRGKFNFIAVLIGTGAGSIANLAPNAKNNDGLFDVVALRKLPIWEFPFILLKILFRTHIKDRRILHFQTKELNIIKKGKNPVFDTCNLDGEEGSSLPVNLKFAHRQLVFVHKK